MNRLLKIIMNVLLVTGLCSCSKSNNVIVPEVASCPLQIGVVMSASGIDNGYNNLAWSGIKKYANSVNLSSSCYQYLEASENDESYVEYLRSFADYMDIVIAADPIMKDDLLLVAEEFRGVTFLLVDDEVDAYNIVSLNYDEKFKTFLAGVLAANYALKNQSYNIGYIGANEMYQAIFEQGVTKLNPGLSVGFSSDLEHDFTDTYIYYYENEEYHSIVSGDEYIEIRANSIYDLISRDIPEDIYNILKAKERKKLVIEPYNSRDFIINDPNFAQFVFESKKIISKPSFEYQLVPTYITLKNEAINEEKQDNNEEEKNDE